MDLERAMEFILEQHAKTQMVMAELIVAQKETEVKLAGFSQESDRRMARLERSFTTLAKLGMRARNDLRRRTEEHEKRMARLDETLQEISDKLNGLIGYVDRFPKRPPQ